MFSVKLSRLASAACRDELSQLPALILMRDHLQCGNERHFKFVKSIHEHACELLCCLVKTRLGVYFITVSQQILFSFVVFFFFFFEAGELKQFRTLRQYQW